MSQSRENVTKMLTFWMKDQLRCDLTVGREDNDLKAFTKSEIIDFVKDKEEDIKQAAEEMYDAFEEDDDLYSLSPGNFEADWIREFLYDHVDMNKYLSEE